MLKNVDFSFSTELTARPFKWTQRIAGIDLLSERLSGTGRADLVTDEVDADAAPKTGNLIGTEAQRVFREGRVVKLIKALITRCKSQKSLK